MVELLLGKPVREEAIAKIKEEVKGLSVVPLAKVIYAENCDGGSKIYVQNKLKLATECGIDMEIAPVLWEDKTKEEIIEQIINYIKEFNGDDSIQGYFIQLPIKSGVDGQAIKIEDFVDYIDSKKDLDGFTKENFANTWFNIEGLGACTPQGVIDILDYYGFDLEGKNVLVVNRSHLIGMPIAGLLINRNATVTIAHSKTKDLKKLTKSADIVILGTGQTEAFDSSYFRGKEQVIIDCTISRNSKGKLCGDLHPNVYKTKKDLYIAPSPGGVGLMTVVNLMNNVIKATKLNYKENTL